MNNSDNKEINSILDVNIASLLSLLFKYRFTSICLIAIPILISVYYLQSRDIYYQAEIIIAERDSNTKIPQLLITKNHNIDGIKNLPFSNELSFKAFLQVINQIDDDDLDDLDLFDEKVNANQVYVDTSKKNEVSIKLLRSTEENSKKILLSIMDFSDKINKRSIIEDMTNDVNYLKVFINDKRLEFMDQILLKENFLKIKIMHAGKLQDSKIAAAKLIISENLKLAESINLSENLIFEFSSDTAGTALDNDINFTSRSDKDDYNPLETRSLNLSLSASNYSTILKSGIPPVLFGSKILKEELNIIENREDKSTFSNIIDLNYELEYLNSIKENPDSYISDFHLLLGRIRNIESRIQFIKENLFDKDFKTVSYNSNKIMVSQSSVSSALIIFLSLILGFIVALSYAANRQFINKTI